MLSTVCIFPVSAQWVPLYDTSFPISVEQCTRTTLSDTLLSLLEFFVTVVGSGVHGSLFSTRYLRLHIADSLFPDCWAYVIEWPHCVVGSLSIYAARGEGVFFFF